MNHSNNAINVKYYYLPVLKIIVCIQCIDLMHTTFKAQSEWMFILVKITLNKTNWTVPKTVPIPLETCNKGRKLEQLDLISYYATDIHKYFN